MGTTDSMTFVPNAMIWQATCLSAYIPAVVRQRTVASVLEGWDIFNLILACVAYAAAITEKCCGKPCWCNVRDVMCWISIIIIIVILSLPGPALLWPWLRMPHETPSNGRPRTEWRTAELSSSICQTTRILTMPVNVARVSGCFCRERKWLNYWDFIWCLLLICFLSRNKYTPNPPAPLSN